MQNQLQDIVQALNKDKIAIVTGMKNSGKNKTIQVLLKKIGKEGSSFHFNKYEDIQNQIKNAHDLDNLLNQFIYLNNSVQIIILENISKIDKIKDFIGNIYSNGYKIIIIGNNIKIGGIKEIEILPNSNIENLENNIKYGLINDVNLISNISFKEKYLNLLVNDIITNSIFKELGVKSIDLYNYTISFLAFNNKYSSLRDLQKEVNNNQTISLKTLIDYVDYSLQSKVIKRMYKFDLKSNKQITSKAKYYFTDNGIRNSLTNFNLDKEILIENLLYIDLLKKGYTVYGGINGKFNFTFYCEKPNTNTFGSIVKIYIHISEASDRDEIKKEVNRLNKIRDNFKKYLIVDSIDDLGIKKLVYDEVEIVELKKIIKELD